MEKRYELTDESKAVYGWTGGELEVHRIRALKDFVKADGTMVHAGDLGGYIESEDVLSQVDNDWVDYNMVRLSINPKLVKSVLGRGINHIVPSIMELTSDTISKNHMIDEFELTGADLEGANDFARDLYAAQETSRDIDGADIPDNTPEERLRKKCGKAYTENLEVERGLYNEEYQKRQILPKRRKAHRR